MKRIIKIVLILLTILLIMPFGINFLNSQDSYIKIFESGDNFKLYYYVKGEIVYFKMEGKITGYLVVGFEPTSKMKDADMVFGYVVGKNAYVFDAYSTGEYGPHPEDTSLGGKNSILDSKGTESNGITTIEFSRYLDTKDKYDKVITFDKNIKIIWAISDKDDFNAKHTQSGSGTIILKKMDEITKPTPKEKIILKLMIGNKTMYVNDEPKEIDVSPLIIEGRTLLPIRWIAEPLGAIVGWDGVEKKVTITLGSTKIELWIGKNIAKVNGNNTPIDPNNAKVVPIIKDGRTMLPVRYVAENLGCEVGWDAKTQTVTITYPK